MFCLLFLAILTLEFAFPWSFASLADESRILAQEKKPDLQEGRTGEEEVSMPETQDLAGEKGIREEAQDSFEEEEPRTEEAKEEKPENPEKPKRLQLGQPATLCAIAVKDGIMLGWKRVPKAQKYEVYRRKSGMMEYELIKDTKEHIITDTTAEYGILYAYKIQAVAREHNRIYKGKKSERLLCRTYRIDPSKPMVAVTFDDGPSQYTADILDVLEKYNSRATFFEVGTQISQYLQTVYRIHKMGCEIGNHSYGHPALGSCSVEQIQNEIRKTDAMIEKITKQVPVLFRPPYGNIGDNLRRTAGKPLILWSIDTRDWQTQNASMIYQSVIENISDGDIVLMHDFYGTTRDAARNIIPELRRRGFQLVTVSELAKYRKIEFVNGQSYFKM